VDFENRKDGKIALILLIIVYSMVVIRNAWVSDDAYITFRTIENFLRGYGLTYNIGERVQTFTHPLWMFLISAVYFLVNRVLGIGVWAELYYLVTLISILISIATVCVLAFGISRTVLSAILGITILTLSKAFVDYSTSGLENPLSHLLLVIFIFIYFRTSEINPRKMFLLSLLAALGTLNRPDTFLLYLPVLVYAFWRARDKARSALGVLLGFLPLIAWEGFSLIYYGFLSPNTAFAKLDTGIALGMLAQQGFYYYLNSISLDPLTLLSILFVIVLTFTLKEWRFLPFILGLFLYMLYVIRIGGDFMSGRYFAAPLLVAVALLTMYRFSDLKAFGLVYLVVLLVGFSSPRPPALVTANIAEFFKGSNTPAGIIDENGISDERLFYHDRMALLKANSDQPFPGSSFAGKKWKKSANNPSVEQTGPLGVFGYVSGPNVHVIDLNGLADPLMARLPVIDPKHWRIGHFRHIIPDGYIDSLSSGQNKITDENLARYYDKLSLITKGRIFDPQRLLTIIRMNLGQYNSLIKSYLRARNPA